MKIKEELQEILDDHRSQIIDMLKEDAEEALVVDVEANLDRTRRPVLLGLASRGTAASDPSLGTPGRSQPAERATSGKPCDLETHAAALRS